MTSATWTCPRCGAVHSIYSMTCNCPAPSVATDSTDYVFDLRPMKSERINFADRIAALEAQIEAAHRAIDSIGLSRCADAHAGVYPDGRITCDDGRPPLSLVERVEWLIRWLSDDPYPMGPRIKALEAALDAAQDDAARLRAVIEKVEWGAENTPYWSGCMWCKKPYPNHAPDCQRQAALAQTGEVKA